MTAQDALAIATGAALLSATVFILVYAARARRTWWRDPLGRMLMFGGFAVGTLAAVGTVRRVDNRVESIDLAHQLVVASTFAYLAVSAVWAYKALVVFKVNRRRRRRRDDERGDQ